jgi:CRISPR/Cas system-associated exonuclease Cas4 (RecB family)
MAVIDFIEAYDEFVKANQKVWGHDRSKSVGASEAFGCLRKTWFSKNGASKDPDHKDSWGALERGNIIENHFAEPAITWFLETFYNDARLIWGGANQQTLSAPDAPLTATPDGLVINADDDALALYGIPSLGGTGCFNFEIKSIDPRVNLKEEKAIHRGQVQVQMGTTRETTEYRPNYAVIVYLDASFLDDIEIFVVPFDQKTYDIAKERARSVYEIKNVAEIFPEGKVDGGCEYCPFKIACAQASGKATPTDGDANQKNTPSRSWKNSRLLFAMSGRRPLRRRPWKRTISLRPSDLSNGSATLACAALRYPVWQRSLFLGLRAGRPMTSKPCGPQASTLKHSPRLVKVTTVSRSRRRDHRAPTRLSLRSSG